MTILEMAFLLATAMHIGHWSGVESGFHTARRRSRRAAREEGKLPPLSVIVAAHNEAPAIATLIEALMAQNYEQFEVVIVDDNSSDETLALARECTAGDARFRIVFSPGFGKKAAVASGIGAASYDVCVFTDADCRPGPEWLAFHGRLHRSENPRVVVGYAPLRTPGSLLGLYQRFDTDVNAMYSAAAIGSHRAYMATGRNFSYTRSLFDEVSGFDRHMDGLSGDDDILLQDIRTKTEADILWLSDPEAVVESDGKATFRGWFRQKKRHASAGRYFVREVKISLGFIHATQILIWLAPLVIGIKGVIFPAVFLAFQLFYMLDARKQFGSRFPLGLVPLLSFLSAVHMAIVPVIGLVSKRASWGGRSE